MKTKKKKIKVEVLFPVFKVNKFLRKDLRLKLIRCTILLGIIFAFGTTIHQLFSLHGDYQLADNTTMMASTTEWGFDQMLKLNPPDDSKINVTGGYIHYHHQQQQQLNHSADDDVAATATTSTSTKIRVIWGIMSHNLYDEEIQRRKVIRGTYLQFYQDTTSSSYDTICSLNDLIDGKVLYPEQCRLAYVFVLGNSNIQHHGPSMLLEYNDSYPLTVVNTNNSETDIVILNIRENGNDGKSPTWFRYATSLLNEEGLLQHSSVRFSYIFKSDSDNLLFPPLLFDFIDTKLPVSKVSSLPEPSRQKRQTSFPPSQTTLLVYGGRIITKEKCYAGFTKIERCESLIGPLWIGGGCYFLSVALARFISDPKSPFDQYAVKLPHEDMCTSNFVYSYPKATTNYQTIQIISEPIRKNQPVYRKHPIKDVAKYRMEWNKYIQQQDQRRRQKKNQ